MLYVVVFSIANKSEVVCFHILNSRALFDSILGQYQVPELVGEFKSVKKILVQRQFKSIGC
jgi:hypothetical protein